MPSLVLIAPLEILYHRQITVSQFAVKVCLSQNLWWASISNLPKMMGQWNLKKHYLSLNERIQPLLLMSIRNLRKWLLVEWDNFISKSMSKEFGDNSEFNAQPVSQELIIGRQFLKDNLLTICIKNNQEVLDNMLESLDILNQSIPKENKLSVNLSAK